MKEIFFKKSRVLITDPCYLLTDKDWYDMIENCFGGNRDQGPKSIEFLESIGISGVAVAINKGDGRYLVWGIWETTEGKDDGSYGVDGGYVCAIDFDDYQKYLEKSGGDPGWDKFPNIS